MSTLTHDPIFHTQALQQAITPDKMPIGFLLGAGCPSAVKIAGDDGDEPLIPAVNGLTLSVSKVVKTSETSADHFNSICEQLQGDGNSNYNIEDILSHVRSLRQAAGKDEARGLTASQLENLDAQICNAINECVRKQLPHLETAYHRLAGWIGGVSRRHAVEVFTSNYDLLMEQALEESGVPYFDGFVGSHRSFFDPLSMDLGGLPPRWARLWKLHGSINWRQDLESKAVSRGEPLLPDEIRLIHPSHLKYDESRQMPYLAMFDRLSAFFRRTPVVLVTCGFSFSDQHLNAAILQGLQGNPSAVCFALLHGNLDQYGNAITAALRRANLNLLALDGAVVGGRRGQWQTPPHVDPSSHAISVNIQEESGPQSGRVCRFALGDFERLGIFLAVQIGLAEGASVNGH